MSTYRGMSKREVFAMAIMPALVADNERHGTEFGFDSPAQVSRRAVEYADALLAALSDQPTRQEGV